MNAQPRFALAYICATYDNRDAVVGWSTHLVEGRVFQTAALAHKIAGRENDYDIQHGGDGDYIVWDLQDRRQHFVYPAETLADLDFPF
jgi:hypothetical protein